MQKNLFMPRGFEPVDHPHGVRRRSYPCNYDDGPVVGNMAPVVEALYIGDPVILDHQTRRVTKAGMGCGKPIKGILLQLYDHEGVPRSYRPEGVHRLPWTAVICDDPDQEYTLIDSGNSIRIEDHRWGNANLMDTGGSAATGLSGVCIHSFSVNTAGMGQYEDDQITIIDRLDNPGNIANEFYCRYVVKINYYQRFTDRHRPNYCDNDPGDVTGIICS